MTERPSLTIYFGDVIQQDDFRSVIVDVGEGNCFHVSEIAEQDGVEKLGLPGTFYASDLRDTQFTERWSLDRILLAYQNYFKNFSFDSFSQEIIRCSQQPPRQLPLLDS